MSVVHTPSASEQKRAAELKQQVVAKIRKSGTTDLELAGLLGLSDWAIPNFLSRDWKLDEALRTANALGMNVEISIN